jgi:Ser/Thr protein kinase RdoA (MazF antagonist)
MFMAPRNCLAVRAEIHLAAMSPEVHRLFSPEIRDECFSRFRVTAARLISNWHAFTFEAETPAGPCILKITHSFHRTEDQVEAETDWMLFLVRTGRRAPH